MTTRRDAVVSELKGNVERLITRYIASRDRVRELEREVKAVRERAEALKGENKELREELKRLKVAMAISGREGSEEARNRIGRLTREIDRCIALLDS